LLLLLLRFSLFCLSPQSNLNQLVLVLAVTAGGMVLHLTALQKGFIGALAVIVLSMAWFIPGAMWLGHRRDGVQKDRRWCGLRLIGVAFIDMFLKYPELGKLMLGWAFSAGALSSMVSLSTSYLQFHLGLSQGVTSLLLAAALLFAVPGSFLAPLIQRRFGLKDSFVLVNVIYFLSFVIAPFALNPESASALNATSTANNTVVPFGKCPDLQEFLRLNANTSVSELYQGPRKSSSTTLILTALFVAGWGLGIGMVYPLTNALTAVLIPGGRETTYFGIKVACAKSLVWLPPLLFIVINDAFNSLRFAIMPLAAMFLIAALITYTVNLDKAHAAVEDTLDMRRGAFKNNRMGGTGQEAARIAPSVDAQDKPARLSMPKAQPARTSMPKAQTTEVISFPKGVDEDGIEFVT
jgi:MFS family permease